MNKFFLWCLALCFQQGVFAQTTVYVDSAANGLNNGTSWVNAYKHLDSALKYSHQNNVDLDIYVAKGTYTPTKKAYLNGVQMITADNKDKTFHITNGTSIYGGYPNGGGTRNPLLYPVILDGQISATEQVYHVLYQGSGNGTSNIDGISITRGNCPASSGGFTLFPQGGGFYNEGGADVHFNQVKFIQNSAWMGGAVYYLSGGATFTMCEFESNTASHLVGGVYSDHGNMYIQSCIFSNTTNWCCKSDYDGYIQISNTLFVGNSSYEGGALHVALSDEFTLRNCTFFGNQSTVSGGAIYTPEPGLLQMYNCIFYANIGNGVSDDVSWGNYTSIQARNCSFQNPNTSYPTGMFVSSGIPSLFFNQNPQFADTSNVKGADNRFGTADDGLILSASSICINTGNNNYIDTNYLYDLAGGLRIQGISVDRGAYEQDCFVTTNTSTAVTVCGSYFWPVNGQTYTSSGNYTAQQACTIHSLQLTVNPIPVIGLNGSLSVCTGTSTQITASAGNTYTWIPGNLTGPTVALAPTLTTNYTVTATSSAGCSSSSIFSIVVKQLPSVQTSASSTSVCPGSPVTITGSSSSGTNTYVWQPGNYAGNPFTAYPTVATTYTVTGTSTTTGCTKTATRTISMKSVPNVSTTATPTVVCSGASSTLTATGGTTYVWQPSGATTSSITVNPISTSVYTVTGTSATTGCTKSATRTITVNCGNILNTTCFIEGYYLGNQTMQPVFSNQGLSNPINQSDSITVELHQTVFPYDMVYSVKTVLLSNGTCSVYFPASTAGTNYYIVLKHRNALETWSANPVLFSTNLSYNFSDSATKAFGDNLKDMGSGIFALYSGDINSDGAIDIFDYLLMDPDIVNGSGGYLNTDINGDGSTDVFDYLMLTPSIYDGIGAAKP